MVNPNDKMGFCPNPDCGCEDEIYLLGEVKIGLVKKDNYDMGMFGIEDVYVCPPSLRHHEPEAQHAKFKCQNCGHIFDEPAWEQ